MKHQDPDFSKHSRLTQHLSLLDLEDSKIPSEDTAAEAEFINRMKPRPLRVPSRVKVRKVWYLAPLAMAAAVAALMVFQEPTREPASWTVKGAGNVQIHVEKDGRVQTLEEAGALTTDARIKAEVLAATTALAFWGVSSRDGRLLQDPEWIWQNRMILEPREKKSFPGSLQLDGPSEGETLCVVVCPLALASGLEKSVLTQELANVISSQAAAQGNLTPCKNSCFQLRP